jgi:hypothetical protein
MGLASQSCRPGDKVCVFLTARTPFVIRPVGENFTLVSDAYVDGVMYGEALKRDDVELWDFVLERDDKVHFGGDWEVDRLGGNAPVSRQLRVISRGQPKSTTYIDLQSC